VPGRRVWRPVTQVVNAASTAVMSTAASTRRNVAAPATPSACGAIAAPWAIATQDAAPAITACSASSSTDCSP
jgi:hypothetical protein